VDTASAVSARVTSPGDLSCTGGVIEQSDELNNGRGARGEPLLRVVRVRAPRPKMRAKKRRGTMKGRA
jgi:hypothetical protein